MKECILIRKESVNEALAHAPTPGKKLLEPIKSLALSKNLPCKVLEDFEVTELEGEIHQYEGDLWLCLEGNPVFVYGGELVDPQARIIGGSPNPRELFSKEIRGGTIVTLNPGDWLWVPPGQPHGHTCAGAARLMIIKVPKS